MTDPNFFSNFFVVEDPASKKAFRGHITNDIGDFGRLLRTEHLISHLDIENLEGGNEPGDLFWNRVTEPICVNQKVIDLFKENNLTGWTTIPTTVKSKAGKLILDNYFALTVHGRTDVIDYLKTSIVFKQMPGGKYPYFQGLYFDPKSWDGSDIFMTREDVNGKYTAFIYVTKKFVDTFKKNKITNIKFVNFNDYELDCFIIQNGATKELRKKIDDKIRKACA